VKMPLKTNQPTNHLELYIIVMFCSGVPSQPVGSGNWRDVPLRYAG